MRAALRRLEATQRFNPTVLGAFVNPFYLARRALWEAMAELAPAASGRLLDVGCGTQPYRALFDVDEYVGLEVDSPNARAQGIADLYYDGASFPTPDRHFDTVLCNQVLEHVFNPNDFIDELHRVLVPGGQLLLTVPFIWDEHEQPHDFARYSSFGLRAMLERHGFRVIEHRKLLADFSVLCQLLNAWIFKVMQHRGRLWNLMATASVMGPISLVGAVLARVLPKNQDLYLDQAIVAERIG